jgi:hypothetical protein
MIALSPSSLNITAKRHSGPVQLQGVHFQGSVIKDPSLANCRVTIEDGSTGEAHHYLSEMQAHFQPLFDWVEKSTHNTVTLKWHATKSDEGHLLENLTLIVPSSNTSSGEGPFQEINFLSYWVQSKGYHFRNLKDIREKIPSADKLIRHLQFWVDFFAPQLSASHQVGAGDKEV